MTRQTLSSTFRFGVTLLFVQCFLWGLVLAQEEEEGAADAPASSTMTTTQQGRMAAKAKQWYLGNVKIGGLLELPVDYVTLVVGVISAAVLYYGF